MINQLTQRERRISLYLLSAVGLAGLFLSVAGRGNPIAIHGLIIVLFSVLVGLLVYRSLSANEPGVDRLKEYYDDPTKVGIILSILWGVVGMAVGNWIAWLMAYPDFTFDAAWASYGRLRPVHASGVIFGFGGNALIATSYLSLIHI